MLYTPKMKEVATATGFDLDRYYREHIRPVWEEPADAPENPYWPDLTDLDAKAGIDKAEKIKCEPTKNRVISGVRFQGWQLADGFWIGRYRTDDTCPGEEWSYCSGQNWDDIWQG